MAKKQAAGDLKEVGLLRELCGSDLALYNCLSNFLYENPLKAISSESIGE